MWVYECTSVWLSFDSVWLYLTVIHSHCPCESKDLFPNAVCCKKIQHQHNRTLKTTLMGICAAALATVPSLTPWKHLVWTAMHKMVVWLTLRFVMSPPFYSLYSVLFFLPIVFPTLDCWEYFMQDSFTHSAQWKLQRFKTSVNVCPDNIFWTI